MSAEQRRGLAGLALLVATVTFVLFTAATWIDPTNPAATKLAITACIVLFYGAAVAGLLVAIYEADDGDE